MPRESATTEVVLGPAAFYGGDDPRELAFYTTNEAARYLGLSSATLRTWVAGRRYPKGSGTGFSEPLIASPAGDSRLSFSNLMEAHVLKALRSKHHVPMHAVRVALEYAQQEYGIGRLLLDPRLRAAPGEVFLDRLTELVNLGRAGQLAIKSVLNLYLERLERDPKGLPIRFFPFVPGYGDAKDVVIDPRVSFGRPVVRSRGISTAVIAERVDAGEAPADIAADYDLEDREVDEAIVYERAA